MFSNITIVISSVSARQSKGKELALTTDHSMGELATLHNANYTPQGAPAPSAI